jgi:RNA polymerase sigma factor (sigma-70 family)
MRPDHNSSSYFTADLRLLDSVKLVSLCANHVADNDLWSEFLRRFTGKIKLFIWKMLQRRRDPATLLSSSAAESAVSDLFQNTLMRFVENDCAALRRFTGSAEEELLAYFAVIARSVVCDALRRQRALKRPSLQSVPVSASFAKTEIQDCVEDRSHHSQDRKVLAQELEQLSLQMIEDYSGEYSDRDRLIFRLYYFYDLSVRQISKCEGLGLSKTAVENVLIRLRDRVRSAVTAVPSTEATQP